ncbi:TPA: hypothetical protein N2X82_002389 [Escherichia coli]|nr:hypothetical protein [Escherichia coli]
MFYIKFNGYKKDKEECEGLFSVGEAYACDVDDSGRYYQVRDDDGKTVKFTSMLHDSYYNFSRVELNDVGFNLLSDTHDGKMKYRMNWIDVTKSLFDEKLIEAEELKSNGASVFIDFEVYFE